MLAAPSRRPANAGQPKASSRFSADPLADLDRGISSHADRPPGVARAVGFAPHLPIGIGAPDRGSARCRASGSLAHCTTRHWTVRRRDGERARRALERPGVRLGALVEADPTLPPPTRGTFLNVHRRVPVEDVGYAIVPRILSAHSDQSATAAHRLGVDVGMLARYTHIDQCPTRPPTAAPARVATRAPAATPVRRRGSP